MSAMNPDSMPEIQEQANNLRQELKEWEKSFAAANQGRKAGRDDIKTHPIIAAKYKTYTKLRDLLSGHAPLTSHSSSPHPQPHAHVQPQPRIAHQPSRKRKHSIDAPRPHQTPQKLPRHTTSTPLRIQHPSDLDPYDSPSSIRALTHTPRFFRTSIGPTPQRDGHVLGLFDAFPDAAATPSKSKLRTTLGSIPAPNAAPNGNGTINGTVTLTPPSKKRATVVENRNRNRDEEDGCGATPSAAPGRRQSRTPTSAGRRFLLDSYVTPTARRTLLYPGPGARDGEGAHDNGGSAASLRFATPAFLRRDGWRLGPALADGDWDCDGEASPGKGTGFGRGNGGGVRLPLDLRAPVRGGLSSLLAGLRKMEDERLDGEMDVLREVEREENGDGKQTNNNVSSNSGLLGTKYGVLVRDSQAGTTETRWEKEMPLGVDRGSSDFDSDSESDFDAQAKNTKLRTYKKKGQKRTTRRVVMRPQPARPSSGKLLDPSATVNITGTSTDISTAEGLGAEAARSEPVGGGGGGGHGGGSGSGDVGKKAGRKISATAHANYRTLKLRGKGAKSKGKGNGSGRRKFEGRR